ncbi:MAG: acyl-CoA dehydrogenase family protein [Promethearchaeia archaeon]
MTGKEGDVQCISPKILQKMSLKNRYKFLNNNLINILKPKDMNFLKSIQKFYTNYEKEQNIDHSEDFYGWIPDFGKEGLITHMNQFQMIDLNYEHHGMVAEFSRVMGTDFFDPQLAMGMGATVLAINPLTLHHEDVPVRLEALKDMVTGNKIGCVCITEPERGSDAVHMTTLCEKKEDGSFTLNGTKIYQTNGPKADWAIVYATTERDSSNQMVQFLVNTEWEGWNVQRVNIPWTPRIYIGKETFTDLTIPKDCILGEPGEGRELLFEGLNLERLGIVILNLAEAWNALTHANIYVNMRKQFGQEILKFQGVGFTLADMWSKVMTLTLATLHLCEIVDEKLEKFDGAPPKNVSLALGVTASQLKYRSSKLTERACYECGNLMGGAGVCDNTLMEDLIGISRIQEIGGGTRQIQQYIMSLALKQLFKMI